MPTQLAHDLLNGVKIQSSADGTPRARLLIGGDLYPGGELETVLSGERSQSVFRDIIPITAQHDLNLVDLECPLTDSRTPIRKCGPHLFAKPDCAYSIHSAGFDIVTLANNHILDMGERGIADTLASCQRVGLQVVGAGENLADATRPLLLDVCGVRVGILAVTEHEFSIATRDHAGAAPLDIIDIFQGIQRLRQQADFILVVLHGGHEYYPLPSPRIVKTCRFLVDVGANAVVCHHVHVPGGVEIYQGAPIVYSTGNFLFNWPQPKPVEWYQGYLVSLIAAPRMALEMRLIPFWQCRGEMMVQLMVAHDAEDFIEHIADLSMTIANEGALMQEWERLWRSKRMEYLKAAYSLNKFERALFKVGVTPFWRQDMNHIAHLLNLFNCEAHRDIVSSVLAAELAGGWKGHSDG